MGSIIQEILSNRIISFFLLLVPLVVFHEFGHFVVAKLGGFRVYKFAFGFGKKLFSFEYAGTEYRWNLIPLGGYVDFMGEVIYTDKIPDDAKHFYNKPKWLRFLVLLMGPMFNIILAFVLYWMMFSNLTMYTPDYQKAPYTVGYIQPNSSAEAAGLQAMDQITAVDGTPIESYQKFHEELLLSPGKTMALTVQRGEETLDLSLEVPAHEVEGYGLREFMPYERVLIREVFEDTPAARGGLKAGDHIVAANGEPVFSVAVGQSTHLSTKIEGRAPEASELKVQRGDEILTLSIAPEKKEDRWLIGVRPTTDYSSRQLTVMEAFSTSLNRCLEDSILLFKALRKLTSGELGIRSFTGPVGISRVASETMRSGIFIFIGLMAFLSLQLGILNLLPIPVLDGGEIFVILIETVSGRDFSLETKMRIKVVGFFFLLGFMGLVLLMDFVKEWQYFSLPG
ncbi:RIP metalloprotease RseP [Acanthopleuribacter pedis]|uniref:Zinc metalloprotease n=1 Tax=Acanthopleuribacter pedis TaxID=442870 RepID=A0A8J7QE51_9BACT|nr:RIP metalloprotease RseP [Acanthopleuribacter pedis]MBO1322189.1 RIP metalloprotease RseP [Acanthopleuribacter pedis]